jgi:ABC-type multidrug transport system ATPase subunit
VPLISLHNIGKKFNREWIFRDLNYEIDPGERLVILGGNGSGKSTLLQVISGFITPNKGEVIYELDGKKLDPEKIKDHISFASPYLQLVEDFTLPEMIAHAGKFKRFLDQRSSHEIIDIIQLSSSRNKLIRQFSSGMKQRLKLGLALLADTQIVLLDEPVSNLDREAIKWFGEMIKRYAGQRTVIVCSNAITEEYFFCDKQIVVSDYKSEYR